LNGFVTLTIKKNSTDKITLLQEQYTAFCYSIFWRVKKYKKIKLFVVQNIAAVVKLVSA